MTFSFFSRRSIKTRLTLSTLVIFVVSLWLLSFYASRMLLDDMKRLLSTQQNSAVSLVADTINRELQDRMTALEQVAPRLTEKMLANPATLQTFLEDRLVVRQLFNGGFFVTDAEGTTIASVPLAANRIGINYLFREHVARALKEGKASVSTVAIGKALGVPIFSLAVPIRASDGIIRGAYVGVVNLDQINFIDKTISNPYGASGGYVLVARNQRLVVTATDKTRVLEVLPERGVIPEIDRFIEGYNGSSILVSPHGLEVLVSVKDVPLADWYVAATLPTAEAFAPIREMQRRMLLATIFLTLLAGLLTWWMVRRQLRPMTAAAETISYLSATKQPAQALPVDKNDEIGELVGGFNQLLETLRTREEALKLNEARLAIIAEMTSDLVYSCQRAPDGHFHIDWIAGDAEPVFGVANATIIERGCWRPFVLDEDMPIFTRAITALQPGQSSDETLRISHVDGSVLWVRSIARVEDNRENANQHQLYGALRDITHGKLDEQRLRQSEARITSILEGAADAIFITDQQGRYQFVNRQATRLLGFTGEQLLAMAIKDITPAEDLPGVQQLFAQELEAGHLRAELRLKRSDGSIVPVEINGVVLPDGSVLGACRDITERKAAEAELEKHRHHLEALVLARTTELAAARDEAEAASRAKSTFLATMSHELRTPMTAIMGMVNLVLRKSTDPKQIDQLTKAKLASQHLLSVINDILDISKIEAGRLTLERVHFRCSEVLDNLVNVIGQKASDKGLSLRVFLPPEIEQIAVLGDPLRLGQILLNFVGNAIKFTEQGAITIRAQRIEDNPGDVLIRWEVTDTGIGIPMADQQRVFSSFEQADGSMTRKYGGTGLGLAISKRLANLMGGEVGVDSQPGQGSTFWCTVRLAKDIPVAQSSLASGTASAEAQLRSNFARARILLVEDEPVNREVSLGLLEDVGLSVDVAEDGAFALTLAREHHYALILMDMQMPNLNGIDATRAIRSDSLNTATPILAMTANAFDESRQVCLDAGMNDHIAKPVDPEKLFVTLLKWLSTGSC